MMPAPVADLDPTVSVCMLAFNHEKYAAQALEGVFAQETAFPVEVVVGEDCSTDQTRAVLGEWQSRNSDTMRVIVRESNVGMMDNLLDTLQACRGTYVAICECDDFWTDPHKLQKQVQYLEAHPDCTLCFHNARVVYEDAPAWGSLFNRRGWRPLTVLDIIEKEWFLPTASLVIRKGALRTYPADFVTFPSGDLALSILVAANGQVHYLDEVMSVYRKSAGGASFPVSSDVARSIRYWERVNTMLVSLDKTLGGRFHGSFVRRIRRNARRLDYIRLRNRLGVSLRLS